MFAVAILSLTQLKTRRINVAQDITSANASLILTCPGVFTAPQQIQGFATDDIYSTDPLEIAETMMGVDGYLSGGMVYNPVVTGMSLMAGSPSIPVFDQIYTQSRAQEAVYFMQGTIKLLSINMKYNLLNGILVTYPPIPDAKKLLQPRRFTIRWEAVVPVGTL